MCVFADDAGITLWKTKRKEKTITTTTETTLGDPVKKKAKASQYLAHLERC